MMSQPDGYPGSSRHLLKMGASCWFIALFIPLSVQAADFPPSASLPRSTATSGADIPGPGVLQIELGATHLGGNEVGRRSASSYMVKYGVDHRFAVLMGGDAFVRSVPVAVPPSSGGGDTSFTAKYQNPNADSGTSSGLEATLKLPTAARGLGSGKRDYGLKGIYGADLPAGFRLDTNIGLTHLGVLDAGQGRYETAWAAAISHGIDDSWTVAADLSGKRQRGVSPTKQLLVAASFSANEHLVFDAGIAAGLNRQTPKWGIVFGVTVVMGRL